MNNNEPIILGKIKKGKTGKPILALIIIMFIGSFILFLPSIINYFGDYNVIELIQNGEIIDFFQNHENYVNKNITHANTKKEEETSKSIINSKAEVKYNNITLKNFIIKTNKIEFDIISDKEINLDESQLFLVLTQNAQEMYTIKLIGTVKDNLHINFNFINKLESILNITGEIRNIKVSSYPSFTTTSDESGISDLTCTKDLDKIIYTFELDNLNKIEENYRYIDQNNGKYLTEFEKYTSLNDKIILNNGISNIVEDNTGFTFNTNIDLKTFKYFAINNYYSLNIKSNIIKFEMNTKGYDCK